jgi:hypothetical protein
MRKFMLIVLLLIFGCAKKSNPTAVIVAPKVVEYTVTLTGTIVNLIGTQLDSVHIVLWIPFSHDTAKSNGTFSISFQAQDTTFVSDSITFSRSGFLSTTTYFAYDSTANTVNFSAIVMRGITRAQDTLTIGGMGESGI